MRFSTPNIGRMLTALTCAVFVASPEEARAQSGEPGCEDLEPLEGCNLFDPLIEVGLPSGGFVISPSGVVLNDEDHVIEVYTFASGCLRGGASSAPGLLSIETSVPGFTDGFYLSETELTTTALYCEPLDQDAEWGVDLYWNYTRVSLEVLFAQEPGLLNAAKNGVTNGSGYTMDFVFLLDDDRAETSVSNPFIPLSSEVFFGSQRATLLADYGPAQYDTDDCYNGLFITEGFVQFQPIGAANDSWDAVIFEINGPSTKPNLPSLCLRPDVSKATSAGVPLRVDNQYPNNVYAPAVAKGTVEGFELEVNFHLKSFQDGLEIGDGVLVLPPGVAWHRLKQGVPNWSTQYRDFDSPRGATRYPLSFGTSNSDFTTLVAQGTNEAILLTAETLPFAVQVPRINVDLTAGYGGHRVSVPVYSGFGLRWLRNPSAPSLSGRYGPLDAGRNSAVSSGARPLTNDVMFASAYANCVVLRPDGLYLSTGFSEGAGTTHFPRGDLAWSAVQPGVDNYYACETSAPDQNPGDFDVQGNRLVGRDADPYDLATLRGAIDQRTDCAGCGASGSDVVKHNVPAASAGATYRMSGEGALAFSGELNGVVEWGPSQAATGAISNTGSKVYRHLPTTTRAHFTVPGFIAKGTAAGNASDYLLGAFDETGRSSLATNDETRRGNGFFAGLTVGPEVYRNSEGQSVVGAGESLAGDALYGAFGGPTVDGSAKAFDAVTTSLGTKYVLRRGGVTGAFNFQSVPTVTAYGFPLALTRFAFTTVNNQGQKGSWVDGKLDLPGWAGFAVPFTSLELQCTGHLGGGVVDRGLLATLPEDDKRLAGWKAPYAIAEVGFAPKPPATQCSAGDRELQVGGSATVAALDKPLDLTSYWLPTGDPSAANPPALSGQATVEFARPTGQGETGSGFFLDVQSNQVLLARNETSYDASTSRGWFELGGGLRLPFWKSPKVVVRAQNKVYDGKVVAERTLLRGTGTPTSTLWTQSNESSALWDAASAVIQPSDEEAGKAWQDSQIQSPFPWVFDNLVFPMRWKPEGQKPVLVPGGKLEADLAILKASGAATRTDPRQTEIKFGASASLDLAAAFTIPTNIDIFSQDSVSKIDGFLRDITGNTNMPCPGADALEQGPLWCVVKYLKKPSEFIAKTVGPMFSGFIQAQVSNLVEVALGPVLDKIAELITTVQAAPSALVNAGLGELTKLVDQGVSQLTTPLSDEVENLYNTVPAQMESALNELDPTAASPGLSSVTRDALIAACALVSDDGTCKGRLTTGSGLSVVRALDGIGKLSTEVTGRVDQVKGALTTGITGLTGAVGRAQCLVKSVRRLVRAPTEDPNGPALAFLPPPAPPCNANSYPELAPVFSALATAETAMSFFKCDASNRPSQNDLFKKVNEITTAVDQVLGAVESDAIPGVVNGVGSFVGVDLTTFSQALKEIGSYAKSIRVTLNSAKTKIEGGFCQVGNGIDSIMAPVRGLLDKLQGPLDKAAAGANSLANTLSGIIASVDSVKDKVNKRIKGATDFVAELRAKVHGPIESLLALDDQLSAGGTISLGNIKTLIGCDPQVANDCTVKIKADFDSTIAVIELALELPKNSLKFVDTTTGLTIVDRLGGELKKPIYSLIGKVQTEVGALFSDLIKQIPFPTRDELRQMLVRLVVNSDFVRDLDKLIESNITLILGEVDKVAARLVEQLNGFVRKAIELANAKIRELLEGVTSAITGAVGFSGASLDGYAKIVGNAIQRLQIDARFDSKPSKGSGDEDKRKDEDQSFRASLVMQSWALSDKGKNCLDPTVDASGMLDASISVYNVPFTFGGQGGLKIQELSFGFTLEKTTPVGFNGALITTGMLDFKAFSIRDIRFAAGFGKYENYVGASAAANFSGYDMSVAFLVGKTCDGSVLNKLDPAFAGFVKVPGAFEGGYVRGSASIPIFNVGCLLKVGIGADFGAWFLNRAIGGLVGGSAFGQIACLASARGTIRLGLTYNTEDGSVFFKGQGWAAAGIGGCSPDKWLTVEDSRKDGTFCFTMDASIDAEYEKSFELKTFEMTGPH